ncbi:MAG: PQQ-binding-like beta-propeller repeat protein [Actinomycetota bacterium]|nr:PQQ-binding-like beta-propeller repeat protein [Actinomycetota bacterium]
MRKRIVLTVIVLLALVGAGAAAAWWWNERATRDVRGSAGKEFVPTEEPGTSTRAEEEVRKEPWPTYGFDQARTRVAAEFDLRPPYRKAWEFPARRLIEFPPVVAYGRLYFANNPGDFFALDAKTGEVVWQKKLKRCSAASPTVADGVIYHAFMDTSPCKPHDDNAPGYLVALDAETGEEAWRFKAGVTESSPLLVDGVLYFGSWDKKIYALDAKTRRVLWTHLTGDKVKGGAAYAKGTVYIGAYDGKVYALGAKSGKLRWDSAAQGGIRGAGNFYATPAVAYGRVFIGNTDGKVYAFGAKSGDLLWSHDTGGYVYGSAAVFDKTVYIGSYDKRFYALDAATGDERWSFKANGEISGAPTVIEDVVYFSTLRERTYALDAKSGRKLWTFSDGKYSPLVADEERVYLAGYKRVYGLEPE